MSISAQGGPVVKLHIAELTNTTLQLEWTCSQAGKLYTISLKEVDTQDTHASKSVTAEKGQCTVEFTDLSPITQYLVSLEEDGASTPTSLEVLTRPSLEQANIEAVHESGCADLTLTPLPEEQAEHVLGYLLLVQPMEDAKDVPEAVITDVELKRDLETLIPGPFYIAKEFSQDQLTEDAGGEVRVGTGTEKRNGLYGVVEDPQLCKGAFYRVIFVVITNIKGKRVVFAEESSRMLVPADDDV